MVRGSIERRGEAGRGFGSFCRVAGKLSVAYIKRVSRKTADVRN
jgi:hypothetical protein